MWLARPLVLLLHALKLQAWLLEGPGCSIKVCFWLLLLITACCCCCSLLLLLLSKKPLDRASLRLGCRGLRLVAVGVCSGPSASHYDSEVVGVVG